MPYEVPSLDLRGFLPSAYDTLPSPYEGGITGTAIISLPRFRFVLYTSVNGNKNALATIRCKQPVTSARAEAVSIRTSG